LYNPALGLTGILDFLSTPDKPNPDAPSITEVEDVSSDVGPFTAKPALAVPALEAGFRFSRSKMKA